MASQRKINVVVMDMDTYACQSYRSLISRDPRYTFAGSASNPKALVDLLKERIEKNETKKEPLPDLVLLSAEYSPFLPPLRKLISDVRGLLPNVLVLCLSNWAAADLILEAVMGGARGFFLKGDISLGLLHGARRVSDKAFLYTEGLRAYLPAVHDLKHVLPDQKEPIYFECVQAWRPMKHISHRQREAFELRFIFGQGANEAANEMGVSADAINKYASAAWGEVLGRSCADQRDLVDLQIDKLTREQIAFLLYTALPALKIRTLSVV